MSLWMRNSHRMDQNNTLSIYVFDCVYVSKKDTDQVKLEIIQSILPVKKLVCIVDEFIGLVSLPRSPDLLLKFNRVLRHA